ncbi:MAG: LPS assembly lipoprotein LptE [Geminicoccaceae bacterium]
MKRRAVVFAGLVLASTAPLGACGFRPLLNQADGVIIRKELAAIEIKGLGGRLGQHLEIALDNNLNPTSTRIPSRYDLVIRLTNTNKALAIQLDNTITRYNLTLTAAFELKDRTGGDLIYNSAVQRVASYNVRRAPFATLTAQKDAERRAAEEIADDIRILLALHFKRKAQTT